MTSPADSTTPDRLAGLVRWNTFVLGTCLALVWAVAQLLVALGPRTFQVLSGSSEAAGVATAVFLVASAAAAVPMGRLMDRGGRARGVLVGFLVGGAGCLGLFVATTAVSAAAFLVASAVLGFGFGGIVLARTAGADMQPPERRARGISLILLGAAFGAILGPVLFAPLLAGVRDAPADLARPWLIAGGLMALGALAVLGIRVDPRDIARRIAASDAGATAMTGDAGIPVVVPARRVRRILGGPTVRLGVASAVVAQAVMGSMMGLVSLILLRAGHDLASVSIALSAHFLGMFGLVLVAGHLVDRIGRGRAIAIGLAVLAGGVAAFLLGPGLTSVMPAMFAIGLGWNIAFVAATTILSDATSETERAELIGVADGLGVAASAGGNVAAAAALATVGLVPIVVVGVAVSIAPLILLRSVPAALVSPVAGPAGRPAG